MVNHAFTKHEDIDQIIVNRRLGHTPDKNIDDMAKNEIIMDLPKRKSKKYKRQCLCLICWKSSTVNGYNINN